MRGRTGDKVAQLSRDAQERILNLIVDEGLFDAKQAGLVKTEAMQSGQGAVQILAAKKVVPESVIQRATAAVLGVPYVELTGVQIDSEILNNLPKDVAERVLAVPVSSDDGRITIATVDATNIQMVDYISTLIQKPIRTVLATEAGIKNILTQYKGNVSNISRAARATVAERERVEQEVADSGATVITQDSEISKALTSILEYSVKSKASDIHIEPLEDSLVVRCRIDGVLRQVWELPKAMEAPLVSHIKILARLKIDEHRVPQDGQFAVTVGDKEVDLRIAISPVVWGEQVVIRLLDKTGTTMDLEAMGMTGRALRAVVNGISKPNGMILTSGPTGSGKSTTLYALIKRIKSEEINIVTLEDPVEYKMDGVNQIQVNVDAGLTFASGLRSILRQDPDVVMVGEIRDSETAGLAVQAALTGHLVFSTLHTNSAAGILPRLIDMGIEPFLLASTLNTVIGQRLVRRIGPKKESYQSSELETQIITEELDELLPKNREEVASVSEDLGYTALPMAKQKSYTLMRGIDSKETPGGYKGRAGLYETIEVDEDIQKLIVSHATSAEIMKIAKMKGTITMRQDGILKAINGITTLDEVNRVASDLA